MVHLQGIQLHVYLEDWLGKAPQEELCIQHSKEVVSITQALGWAINWTKSDLIPRQVFIFLGVKFDLVNYRVSMTEDNRAKLLETLSSIQPTHLYQARHWQHIIGILSSQEKLVLYGQLHTKPFHHHLASHWTAQQDPPQMLVPVAPEIMDEVRWSLQEESCSNKQLRFYSTRAISGSYMHRLRLQA